MPIDSNNGKKKKKKLSKEKREAQLPRTLKHFYRIHFVGECGMEEWAVVLLIGGTCVAGKQGEENLAECC